MPQNRVVLLTVLLAVVATFAAAATVAATFAILGADHVVLPAAGAALAAPLWHLHHHHRVWLHFLRFWMLMRPVQFVL
jgi:hypothetical protein